MKRNFWAVMVATLGFAWAAALPAHAIEVVAGSPYSQQADYTALKNLIEGLRANVATLTDQVTKMQTCNAQKKIWDGTACQSVGGTAGSISAFSTNACPSGWTEYTPARGRFIRGIDHGAGNDPDGTRSPGSVQGDAIRNIYGLFGAEGLSRDVGGVYEYGAMYLAGRTFAAMGIPGYYGSVIIGFDASRIVPTAPENRPKNVAVLFCQFNG